VLVGGNELRTWTLERDETLLADLAEAEARFWNLVTTRVSPPVDGHPATTKAIKQRFTTAVEGASVDLDPDLVREMNAVRRAAKDADTEKERVENLVRLALGDCEIGKVDGKIAVTWKETCTNRLDSAAVKAAHPEIYQQFVKTSSARRFLPKGEK